MDNPDKKYKVIVSDRAGEMIPPNKYRKQVVAKRYLIIFQIRDEIVYVEYVLDCRQDYGWLI